MVTLNPFTIYDNIQQASKIAERLPHYQRAIEGACAGEREKARVALRKLGKLKRDTFKKDGGTYTQLLNALQALQIPEGATVEFKGTKEQLPSIRPSAVCEKACDTASAIACGTATGLAAGGVTGALVSFGAYSLAGLLGTAGTGTAISSLSGAAAVNATLAWLGGGTLAAGGLGMAGGALALTGLIALPALLITGISLGAKSETLCAEAMSELEKMRVKEKEFEVINERLREIARLAALSQRILARLDGIARELLPSIQDLRGADLKNSGLDTQEKLYRACSVCDLINAFAGITIVDDEGRLCATAKLGLSELESDINSKLGEE